MKESDHPFVQHSQQNSTPQPPSPNNRRRDDHRCRPNEQVLIDDPATDFVKPSSFSPNQDVTFTWMDDYLPVFRGPLIFCMVVTWIALPPVLEYITQPSSWPTIFTTLLLFGSLLVTFHDVTVLCLNHTRSRLAHWIQHEAPSLDHLLAILYKFQTDATVTATASGMGHFLLYAGGVLSTQQRLRVIQAAMEWDEKTARKVVLEPGGWLHHILPDKIRAWILPKATKRIQHYSSSTPAPLCGKQDGQHDNDHHRSTMPHIVVDFDHANTLPAHQLEESHDISGSSSLAQPHHHSPLQQVPDGSNGRGCLEDRDNVNDERNVDALYQSEKDRIRTQPQQATESHFDLEAWEHANPARSEKQQMFSSKEAQSSASALPSQSVETVLWQITQEILQDLWQRHKEPIVSTGTTTAAALAAFSIPLLARSLRRIPAVVATLVAGGMLFQRLRLTTNSNHDTKSLANTILSMRSSWNLPFGSAAKWKDSLSSLASLPSLTVLKQAIPRLVEFVRSKASNPKWQGMVAALILWYWGQRRRRSQIMTSG